MIQSCAWTGYVDWMEVDTTPVPLRQHTLEWTALCDTLREAARRVCWGTPSAHAGCAESMLFAAMAASPMRSEYRS